MINNRMLAVAAVLAMAVPALGAATPIVVPPVPEQLVEGHTVFTVIEILAVTQTNETRFAAAVAVLVREYTAEERAQRFPGVLWFNDQYLVNPYQNDNAAASWRHPCGGAVLAVNRGDPDPRMVIARVGAGTPQVLVDGTEVVPSTPLVGATYGADSYTYDETWTKPYPGTYSYQNDYSWVGADASDAQVSVDTADPTASSVNGEFVTSDSVVGTTGGSVRGVGWPLFGLNITPPWDYRESYLITDPNDHSWVIDKYEFYTRDSNVQQQNVDNLITKLTTDPAPVDSDGDGIADTQPSEHYPETFGGALATEYAYPVWAVNILGTPAFIVDDGDNCVPFKDLIEDLTAPVNGALCGVAAPNPFGTGADDEITLNAYNGVPPWTDDPCMSYEEESRNGYCYGGQVPDADGCSHINPRECRNYSGNPCEPLREYNALLYFKLEDLRVFDAPRDHSDPNAGTDTNGCSEEQYAWGPNPPRAADDWPCPGDDDNAEGNSHPFHPTTPGHEVAEACRPEFFGPNPSNHGGSTYITPGMRANDAGWYEFAAPCDYLHATRNIDIYFNGGGRPFPPVVRNFVVVDLEGSSAPFNDYHCAYEGQPCGSETEDPVGPALPAP